jgi:hypothetical protein
MSDNKDEDTSMSGDSGWAPAKHYCEHVAAHVHPFPPNATFKFGISIHFRIIRQSSTNIHVHVVAWMNR